jgi:hypothetical protein
MERKKYFPVKSYEGFRQEVLDGITIYKSPKRWIDLVVVRTPFGKLLKLYSWVRKDGEWKVDLANLNIGYWDFQKFAEYAENLREKYKINRQFGIEE